MTRTFKEWEDLITDMSKPYPTLCEYEDIIKDWNEERKELISELFDAYEDHVYALNYVPNSHRHNADKCSLCLLVAKYDKE